MPSCVVKWCINRSEVHNKNCGITFHAFPKDPNAREKWTKAVRLERQENGWTPTKTSRICSIHFNSDDFHTSNKGYRMLKTKRKSVPICTMVSRNPELVPSLAKKQRNRKTKRLSERISKIGPAVSEPKYSSRNADSKAGDSDSDSSNVASGFPGATAEIDSSGEHSDFDDELAGAGREDPTLDDLQKKWKHLRDYYIREQKKDNLKSGSAAKKRYTSYFQMLSFLDITIEHRNTASSHTLPEDENSTTSCDSLPPTTSPPPLPSNSLSKLSKSKSKIKKLSPFQKSILNRISVKEENDPDKHFLLSLLPDMKMMTDSEKFDFKFEIMTAIKRIKYSKPNPSSSTPSTKEYQIEVDQNELNYDVCKVETVEHSFSEPDPVSFVPATTDSLPEVNMFAVVQYISNNEKSLKLLDYPKLKLLTKNNPNLITSIQVLQTESTYRVRGTVNFDRMTSHMCEIEYDTHTDTITSSECVCGSNPCEHTAAFVMFLSHKPTNKRTERLHVNKSKEGDSRSKPSGDNDAAPSTSTSIQIKVEEETEPSAKRQRVSQEPEVPVEPEPEITVVPLPKDENEPRKSKIECTFSRKSIYALWNYFPGSFPERTKKIQTTLKKKLHDDDYITDLAPLEQRIEHLCVFFDKMEYKSNKAEFTKYVNIKEVVLLERMSRNKNSSYIDPLS